MGNTRRDFLAKLGLAATGIGFMSLDSVFSGQPEPKKPFFEISLAEWSLHTTIRSGKLVNMDFPAKAKNDFGIHAVEYVDQFFRDKGEDYTYLGELKARTGDLGVRNVLIMVDTAGPLAVLDDAKRIAGVESHYKWIEAAKFLGCHSIRVNLRGEGTPEEMAAAATDGLGRLSEYGAKVGIGVIVENHGGNSSDGKWLADVMKQVNNPYCGTLPDTDNFCIERGEGGACKRAYDKYQGVQEMLPYAKGISIKTRDFDAQGTETTLDYVRMLDIIKAGYTDMFQGFLGIEYGGTRMSEDDGIRASKLMLDRLGQQIG